MTTLCDKTTKQKVYVIIGTWRRLRWPKFVVALAWYMDSRDAALEKARKEATQKGYSIIDARDYDELSLPIRFEARMVLAFTYIDSVLESLRHLNKLRENFAHAPKLDKLNFILSCLAVLGLFGCIASGLYFRFANSPYQYTFWGIVPILLILGYLIPRVHSKNKPKPSP